MNGISNGVLNASEITRSQAALGDRRLRCGVCGFSELRTDEAVDREPIYLAECPRCEHRWTSRAPLAVDASASHSPAAVRVERVPARLRREVRPAA